MSTFLAPSHTPRAPGPACAQHLAHLLITPEAAAQESPPLQALPSLAPSRVCTSLCFGPWRCFCSWALCWALRGLLPCLPPSNLRSPCVQMSRELVCQHSDTEPGQNVLRKHLLKVQMSYTPFAGAAFPRLSRVSKLHALKADLCSRRLPPARGLLWVPFNAPLRFPLRWGVLCFGVFCATGCVATLLGQGRLLGQRHTDINSFDTKQ